MRPSDDRPGWANTRPRDAATLMVLDRSGAVPRVLMGRRHTRHVFMPGVFVFPGGRLEPQDRAMASASDLAPEVAERLDRRVAGRATSRARALALAAIRETWEETGLMIGRRGEPSANPAPLGWQDFRERGVLPDLAGLDFVGRAITPPRRRRRFDTRFFSIDRRAVAFEASGFAGPDREFVELVWADLATAASMEVPDITALLLEELGRRESEPGRPAPFFHVVHGRFVRDAL